MSFGVYVHIPYCIQRCRYCDFTTFEQSKILPPKDYVENVKKEIRLRSPFVHEKILTSIYFGGGTPSLIDSGLLTSIIDELKQSGFTVADSCEVTIEINPATVSEKKLNHYLEKGINRFSVGVQSFNDKHLKNCGREHNSADTIETLNLLKKYQLNFTGDILFALPGQSLLEVEDDTEKLLSFGPSHISAYCLTVPPDHPMSQGRAPEEEQLEMFESIHTKLLFHCIRRYEISNFAKPGLESKHNLLYWSNQPFWGVGLSAHSYFPAYENALHGIRFWNSKKFDAYFEEIDKSKTEGLFHNPQNFETLQKHEAITDYCHMFLRTMDGLSLDAARNRFPYEYKTIETRVSSLAKSGLVEVSNQQVRLSKSGIVLSNKVFENLTFSLSEIEPNRH